MNISVIFFKNLDQWFRRCRLKYFYLELWQILFSVDQKICAILKEGIMGNISLKLFQIWTSG